MSNLIIALTLSLTILSLGLLVNQKLICRYNKDNLSLNTIDIVNCFFIGQIIFFSCYLLLSFFMINSTVSILFLTLLLPLNIILIKLKFIWMMNKFNTIHLSILFFIFLILLIASLAPPSDFDTVNYHLTLPKFYIENGSFFFRKSIIYDFFHPFHLSINLFFLSLKSTTGYQAYNIILLILIVLQLNYITKLFNLKKDVFYVSSTILILSKIISLSVLNNSQDLILIASIFLMIINFIILKSNFNFKNQFFFIISVLTTIFIKHHGLIISFFIFIFLFYECYKQKKINNFLIISIIVSLFYIPYLIKNFYLVESLFPSIQYIQSYNPNLVESLINIPSKIIEIFILTPDKLISGPFILLFFFYGIFFDNNKNLKILYLICLIYFFIWIFIFSYQIRYLLYLFPLYVFIASKNFVHMLRKYVKLRFLFYLCLIVSLSFSILNSSSTLIRKIPIATNLINKKSYYKLYDHSMLLYEECNYINENILENETYIIFGLNSYFCNQKKNIRNVINDQIYFFPDKLNKQKSINNSKINQAINQRLKFVIIKNNYRWDKYYTYRKVIDYTKTLKIKKHKLSNHFTLFEVLNFNK